MDKALFTLMTGANRSLQAQMVYANNLANINTVGFRGDLLVATRLVDGEALMNGAEKDDKKAGVQKEKEGKRNNGGELESVIPVDIRKTDFSFGQIEQTGNGLDVAITGPGFIAIQGADRKEAYTRAGDFQVNANGLLTTGRGELVRGNGGPISIPPAEKISIGIDGTISIQVLGQSAATLVQIDRIKLVNPDTDKLVKGGDGLFRTEKGRRARADPDVQLRTGFVERSNVSAVSMLTKIIASARQFEMQVKTMKTVEENSESSARIMQG